MTNRDLHAAILANGTSQSEWQNPSSPSNNRQEFLQGKNQRKTINRGRLIFHLAENRHSKDSPFAFLATYSLFKGGSGQIQNMPLKYALTEYGKNTHQLLEILQPIYKAGKKSLFIGQLLKSGDLLKPLAWESKEAHQFLKDIPLIKDAGIRCRIPDWWQQKSCTLNISFSRSQGKHLSVDSLLEFNAHVLLGEDSISLEEAQNLADQSEGLTLIKGKWVEIDKDRLRKILKLFSKVKDQLKDGASIREALRFQLNSPPLTDEEEDEPLIEVSHDAWLTDILTKLKNPSQMEPQKPGANFKAKLRPYQQRGLNWLCYLHQLRFGACLADDMGLGKTIQVLAFLNHLKENRDKKSTSLLILPTSLIHNWSQEIERFAPSLNYFVAHNSFNGGFMTQLQQNFYLTQFDLVITSYTLIARNEWFWKNTQWTYIILDEAQAIKNHATKQAQSVKRLKSYNRIILTGTPVENRLTDLWSLFDFINPGLLGNEVEFLNYVRGLKRNSMGYGNLKMVLSPYILRRLKTDKNIIADLPEKIELKCFCPLTKPQVFHYQKRVDLIEVMRNSPDRKKLGAVILSSFMTFKQICNHPDLYIGNSSFLPKESGKFTKLIEIARKIIAKQEKGIVFTQFKEMTLPLAQFLQKELGHEVLILHGGVNIVKRKQVIQQFQNSPCHSFLISSLKVGGVGLNLIAANHIIHFDRWWNPAVENQATDRCFRIGQKRGVMVYKLICQGTIEQNIDALMEEKSALAKNVVGKSREHWLSNMDQDEILELFKLSI